MRCNHVTPTAPSLLPKSLTLFRLISVNCEGDQPHHACRPRHLVSHAYILLQNARRIQDSIFAVLGEKLRHDGLIW